MASLDRVLQVTVTKAGRQVTQVGFGTAMILKLHTVFSERARVYGSLAEVEVDFPTGDIHDAAALYFSQERKPAQLVIGRQASGDANVAAAIQAVEDFYSDWYGLILMSQVTSDVLSAAGKIETMKKIFITSSADATILTAGTSDIAYQLKALNYLRTAVIYSAAAATVHLEAAWLGRMLPLEPGQGTWKFKTLIGVVSDNLSEGQITFAEGKNCNVYVPMGGVDITMEGVVAFGEFIDVTVFIDFIVARGQEAQYSTLVNNDKLPFTNQGIAAIQNAWDSVMKLGIRNQGIAEDPAPVISVPDALDVSESDRAARTLSGVEVAFRLAGAIHKTKVHLFVTV